MTQAQAIYAGSFDPFTKGHLSVAKGAYKAFGNLTIAIGINKSKTGWFSITDRMLIINEYFKNDKSKPRVVSFEGLLADFCKNYSNPVIVRGLRAVSDFEQEMAIADANRRLAVPTVFIPTEASLAYISSSMAKEIARYSKNFSDLEPYVIPSVAHRLFDSSGC